MEKIAIITDTDSSLPIEISNENGICQVPITIHFSDESYTTGLDINDRLLFEKIDQRNKLPSTAAPCPEDFVRAFQKAFSEGFEEIICICVSSQISSTFSAAESAAKNFPDKKIEVIDSFNLSMAQGFMVLTAVEGLKNGKNLEEISALVKESGRKMHTYALLSTLKYLALSGRVGKFVAGMSDTFNIKPILTVKNGRLELLEKIRTRKKAIERLFILLDSDLGLKKIERAAIIHVNNPAGAREMEVYLRNSFDCPDNVYIAEFTPGLSVHSGSGVVGIVIQTQEI